MTTTHTTVRGQATPPVRGLSADIPRNVAVESREEERRGDKKAKDENSSSHVPRPQRANDEKKNGGFQDWVVQLIRRCHGAWPGHRWSKDVNREYAQALQEWPQHTAEHVIDHAIRTHLSPYPPSIAAIHEACSDHTAAERAERQARAARALEAQLDRDAAPPWHAWLSVGASIAYCGLTPKLERSPAVFVQIAKAHGLNPRDPKVMADSSSGWPAAALTEAEAAWINLGRPNPPAPTTLIAKPKKVDPKDDDLCHNPRPTTPTT